MHSTIKNSPLALLLLGGFLTQVPIPAAAQLAVYVSMKSDLRFRGRSLSDGQPAAAIELSYDHGSGLYFGGSTAAVIASNRKAGIVEGEIYTGFATRLGNEATLDLGMTGRMYTKHYSGRRNERFAEAYAGFSKGAFSLSAHYSPNYQGRGARTVYTDIQGAKKIAEGWRVNAHAGVLADVSATPRLGGRRLKYDTRLGISHTIGAYEFDAQWTLGGPDSKYFQGVWHGPSAIVFSVSRSF